MSRSQAAGKAAAAKARSFRGRSSSYARALVAEFHARPRAAVQGNGRRPTVLAMAEGDSEIGDD